MAVFQGIVTRNLPQPVKPRRAASTQKLEQISSGDGRRKQRYEKHSRKLHDQLSSYKSILSEKLVQERWERVMWRRKSGNSTVVVVMDVLCVGGGGQGSARDQVNRS